MLIAYALPPALSLALPPLTSPNCELTDGGEDYLRQLIFLSSSLSIPGRLTISCILSPAKR